jgi:hypothetical protein
MTDSHKPAHSNPKSRRHARPEHEGKQKEWVSEEDTRRAEPPSEKRSRG